MKNRKTKSGKLAKLVKLADRLTVLVSDILDLINQIDWEEVLHTISSLLS